MKIEFDEQCKPCNGTGLFQGMAERDGYAVVCHNCKGTGKFHFVHEYEEFTGRKNREGVTNVIQVNPGIIVGNQDNLDFGGITYKQWQKDSKFPQKTEMRQFTCPAWWYQSVDYDKKPHWDECLCCGSFSSCKHFVNKHQCWERWDKEFTSEVELCRN